VRSRISGDWQSFRCLGDQAERPDLIRKVNRRRWARSKMSDDPARGRVEGPEANLKQLKCVEKLKRGGAEMRRQNNNGNMGVKAITIGLCQRLSPVAQLELKRTNDWPCLRHKSLDCQGPKRVPASGGLPVDGDKVRNSVPVHRYLAGHGGVGSRRSMMQSRKSGTVGPGKARNHSFFGTMSGRMVWQVPNRLTEPKLRYQISAGSAHTANVTGACRVGEPNLGLAVLRRTVGLETPCIALKFGGF
jgi:hypothetical protein